MKSRLAVVPVICGIAMLTTAVMFHVMRVSDAKVATVGSDFDLQRRIHLAVSHGPDSDQPTMQLMETRLGAVLVGTARSATAVGAQLCGKELLSKLGVSVAARIVREAKEVGETMQVAMDVSSSSFSDIRFNARAAGPVMIGGIVSPDDQSGKSFYATIGPFPVSGTYTVSVLVTWVGDVYVGQKWMLPGRNDNPPFAKKKEKCLALSLFGNCERFGVTVLQTEVTIAASPVASATRSTSQEVCRGAMAEANGYWRRLSPHEISQLPLLADDVGLNLYDGSHWFWVPSLACSWKWFTKESAMDCFVRQRISRVALFGDSMMLEQFNMLRDIVAQGAKLRDRKSHRLRSIEFTASNSTVVVKFFRSYTTSGGHSVIADPRIIVGQLAAFRPDVAIGNLAVLHWQQNQRSLDDWKSNLRQVAHLLRQNAASIPRIFYVGHTLIQMGRTQGLQPSRTDAFSDAARDLLSPSGVTFVSPYNLSVSRRESAFDGQHWACYHQYGGVSHTIAQLLLNRVCE